MNVAERKQATAPAEARAWLERFEAALQAQDAAGAAALFLPDGLWRDVLAFTWTIQTMAGRAAIEATLRETLARTQPRNFSFPAAANAAALGVPRRHRIHRGDLRLRNRVRPRQRRAAAGPRPASAGAVARLDAQYQFARAPGLRRRVQAARGARLDARLRRRQLARPPRRAARLCRSRSRRAGGRRRPGRACRSPRGCSSSASTR